MEKEKASFRSLRLRLEAPQIQKQAIRNRARRPAGSLIKHSVQDHYYIAVVTCMHWPVVEYYPPLFRFVLGPALFVGVEQNSSDGLSISLRSSRFCHCASTEGGDELQLFRRGEPSRNIGHSFASPALSR
jgi:hypothetical protein